MKLFLSFKIPAFKKKKISLTALKHPSTSKSYSLAPISTIQWKLLS